MQENVLDLISDLIMEFIEEGKSMSKNQERLYSKIVEILK